MIFFSFLMFNFQKIIFQAADWNDVLAFSKLFLWNRVRSWSRICIQRNFHLYQGSFNGKRSSIESGRRPLDGLCEWARPFSVNKYFCNSLSPLHFGHCFNRSSCDKTEISATQNFILSSISFLKFFTSVSIFASPNSSILDQNVELTASNNAVSARFHDRILSFSSFDKTGFESFDLKEIMNVTSRTENQESSDGDDRPGTRSGK